MAKIINSVLEIKGSVFTLPVVCLYSENLQQIEKQLLNKLKQAPELFQNASVVVNISSLKALLDFHALNSLFQKSTLNIAAFSCTNEQKKQVIEAGYSVLHEGKNREKITNAMQNLPMIVQNPIRSGQQIYAKKTDLILHSFLSAGAEAAADGNIHVYNNARGKLLAGANGNKNARIYCISFEAELVSIAGCYWLADDIPTNLIKKPVCIYLKNNKLSIDLL